VGRTLCSRYCLSQYGLVNASYKDDLLLERKDKDFGLVRRFYRAVTTDDQSVQ
jgi:hypothetical protein